MLKCSKLIGSIRFYSDVKVGLPYAKVEVSNVKLKEVTLSLE